MSVAQREDQGSRGSAPPGPGRVSADEGGLLTGIEAIASLLQLQQRVDAERGLRVGGVVSGYPGSPLGGVDLALHRREAELREAGIEHVPGLNEELAAAVVWGSQQRHLMDTDRVDGVVGLWYGKSPGIDRSGDVLKHANSMGTAENGGVLVVVGDDPGAKSSSIPNDTRGAFFDAQIPVLVPSTVEEIVTLGLHGIALSRFSGLWCGLKVLTDLADGLVATDVDELIPKPVLPEVLVDGERWEHRQMGTLSNVVSVDQEHEILNGRLEAVRRYVAANGLNRVTVEAPGAKHGIVASGRAHADLLEALGGLGLDSTAALADAGIRVLEVRAPYPLEPNTVRDFAAGLEEILVVEEKRELLETLVRDALYGGPHRPQVLGKRDGGGRTLIPSEGDLTTDRLVAALHPYLSAQGIATRERAQLAASPGRPVELPLAAAVPRPRVPAFCSGCPHNRSTASAPDGALIGGGVGCHAIVYLEDRHADDTVLPLTPMGAEGVPWIGTAPFARADHLFQNLGDGTFNHSGTLAVRASVAAGVDITFKLLYNSAVAMTGGQDVAGDSGVPALSRELEALGVVRTIVVADDPKRYRWRRWRRGLARGVEVRGRERLAETESELAQISGVTVLLYDQRCAAEARRLWKRGRIAEPRTRAVINKAVCEGCGDCQKKSNCLSVVPVDTLLGRKTEIHQPSCNHDLTCLEGDCPSFVTVVEPAAAEGSKPKPAAADSWPEPPEDLPERREPAAADRFSLFLTGIGGTGVVTASRLLADAARRDGWQVRAMDQTGLSQKAGAVTSHVRAGRESLPPTNSVSAGGADVLLAFDPLTAVQPANLARLDPERTAALVVTEASPTITTITDPFAVPADVGAMSATIAGRARAVENFDADGFSAELFDDHMPANVLSIGAAWQAGFLPISAEAIEAAISSGRAPERNLAAFRWGRALWAAPDLAAQIARPTEPFMVAGHGERAQRVGGTLLAEADLQAATREAAAWRVADLVEYQDSRLARRYLGVVSAAAAAERAAGVDSVFSVAVAEGLYKLMAYKDEYEVARLHLDSGFRRELAAEHPGARVSFRLQPPLFRALGLKRKIGIPPLLARPMFRLLRAGRRLRGTAFDPFGWAHVRRVERELVEEYVAEVAELGELLAATQARGGSDRDPAEFAERCAEIAALPDLVRGYEEIKLDNVADYRQRLAALREEL